MPLFYFQGSKSTQCWVKTTDYSLCDSWHCCSRPLPGPNVGHKSWLKTESTLLCLLVMNMITCSFKEMLRKGTCQRKCGTEEGASWWQQLPKHLHQQEALAISRLYVVPHPQQKQRLDGDMAAAWQTLTHTLLCDCCCLHLQLFSNVDRCHICRL